MPTAASIARKGSHPIVAASGVAFVDSYSNPTGSGWQIVVPATVQVGDLMLVAGCLLQASGLTMTPPAGWTLIDGITGAGGTYNPFLQVWYRVATSSDVARPPATGHVWTSTATRSTGTLIVTRGQAASSFIEAFQTAASVSTSTSAVASSVTTTTDSCLIVEFFGGVDSAGGANLPTMPATSRVADNSPTNYLGTGAATRPKSPAGATGTATATYPQASSWAAMTLAIRP